MTHPSVNSIVERLTRIADASRRDDGSDIPLGEQCREAATIISELQAQNERKDRLIQAHRQQIIDAGEIMKHWQARALTAESSLSRIKAETIEAAALIIMSAPDWHTRTSLANLIRSLGSTGGAEKTAESDHSPSTPTTATE